MVQNMLKLFTINLEEMFYFNNKNAVFRQTLGVLQTPNYI